MRSAFIALMVCLALSHAAWAQSNDDVLSGFKLGKFYSICSVLAMELVVLQGMCGDFDLTRCTQENLDKGVITQEDMAKATIYQAYAQIQAQTLIGSICESGLMPETFDHPALAPYKERIVPLFTGLQADTNKFLAGEDPTALAVYIQALKDSGYADTLQALAEEARQAAGDQEG